MSQQFQLWHGNLITHFCVVNKSMNGKIFSLYNSSLNPKSVAFVDDKSVVWWGVK